MQVGYSVRQPDGKTYKMLEEPKENRLPQVEALLNKWSDYCNRNWLSPNCDDPYSPESKVKAFLGSLAYFLLQGDTDGIVTNYKEIVNGKREIPMSSCPSYVEDKLYSSTSVPGEQQRQEELEAFKTMIAGQDETKKEQPKKTPRKQTRYEKIHSIREEYDIDEFVHKPVNTDGEFVFCGAVQKINLGKYPQYAACKSTDDGDMYGMDQVIIGMSMDGHVHYFDMDYNKISAH